MSINDNCPAVKRIHAFYIRKQMSGGSGIGHSILRHFPGRLMHSKWDRARPCHRRLHTPLLARLASVWALGEVKRCSLPISSSRRRAKRFIWTVGRRFAGWEALRWTRNRYSRTVNTRGWNVLGAGICVLIALTARSSKLYISSSTTVTVTG